MIIAADVHPLFHNRYNADMKKKCGPATKKSLSTGLRSMQDDDLLQD
jgi:hypothetical protein